MGIKIIFRNTANRARIPKYKILNGALANVADRLIQKVPPIISTVLFRSMRPFDKSTCFEESFHATYSAMIGREEYPKVKYLKQPCRIIEIRLRTVGSVRQ
jgi:hypothetical protein